LAALPADSRAVKLKDRHLKNVLIAPSTCLTAILDDTARNFPDGPDLRLVNAVLSNLTSDVACSNQHSAEGMTRGLAPPGTFL
jgi:hypothetical protein